MTRVPREEEKLSYRVVHYLNQFFGQIGGEDKADTPFIIKEGPVGPGTLLSELLGDGIEVVGTIICGDNYFSNNPDESSLDALGYIEKFAPDLFIAGPAFEAGRYGVSCGAVCKRVSEKLNIPAITGMYHENPGVDIYRSDAFIVETGNSAGKMKDDLAKIARLSKSLLYKEWADKFLTGDGVGSPEEYGYFSRGIVKNEYVSKTVATRMVDMLLHKLRGEEFNTELTLPKFESIELPGPINPKKSTIAVVSDGGLCRKGNDAGFSGRGNKVWTYYDVDEFFKDAEHRANDDYQVVHTGYFSVNVIDNINRLVPIDVMREYEAKGYIGKLLPIFISTSGNATVAKECQRMGQEMAEMLGSKNVDGVILTST